MAEDKRISELSPIPTVTPGALFPVVDEITGETMSARFDQMAATVDLDDYALKTYVDAQDIATLDDAKDYADLQDVTNLNAAKAYADGLVVGLWDDRGNFNASVNAYPSTGGSGAAGAIKKGDIWTVSVAGILPSSQSVEVGDTVRALIDNPGNTQANWSIQQNNIGYTAENSANKTNVIAGNEASTTLYASIKGFVDYLVGMTWLTSTIFGAWIVGNSAKTTPVDADVFLQSDSADGNKSKKVTWANIKVTLKTYFDTLYLTLAGGTLTGALNYAPSVTVPSAATTDIGNANSNNIIISGTTTITSFGTCAEGIVRIIRFTGALTLTHNATSLILPNGSNITTQVNDTAIFRSMGSSNWVCISYKSVTTLSNNTLPYWDGTKFVNSFLSQATDNTGITYNNIPSNQVRFRGLSNSVGRWSIFHNGSYTVISSLGGVVIGADYESILGGYYWVKNGENQAYNNIHTFFNGGGTKLAELNSSGLALGSSTINASAQLELQSTSKGFLKNRLTSAQIASISTPAQGLEAFDTDLRNTVFLPVASGNPIRTSGTMFTQTANKQVQNTVTETSLVGTGVGSATIKANSSGIGTTYRLSMCGYISNTATPFAQVKVKIGSITVFDTTSTGMFGITSNQPFKVNAVFTVRTLGASGTVIGQGEFEYATSASTQYQIMFQANTATSTIDTTVDQTVDITFTWGTANASNSINSTNFTLERL